MRISAVLLVALLSVLGFTFEFSPGHFYGTRFFSNEITQYFPNGQFANTATVSNTYADELRGSVFGTNGFLYVAAVLTSELAVLALDSNAVPQQTYTMPGTGIAGNISLGKISFGVPGSFFVG